MRSPPVSPASDIFVGPTAGRRWASCSSAKGCCPPVACSSRARVSKVKGSR
ncbi:MAG TPA: hypothetical protein ENI60_00315 [Candidatus Fraserbacteria bacterium]|nr:hypothetical protein [Candidatus Fraserbacteria bacterium]